MFADMVTVRVLPGCLVRDGSTDLLHEAGEVVEIAPDMADLLAAEQGVEVVQAA
jgi:hypothetical protein